jgi:hypothetical protein
MFISCRPVVHSREIIQRVTSGKRPILFVGLTMTMRWGEEGTTTCFGVHINKGKRHTNNLESGKLLGMAASMYLLYGIRDALLCQCDELDSMHHVRS